MLMPPPPPHALPRGMRLHAGLGFATVLPDCDFEVYSEAGHVWDEAARKWCALPNASQGKKGLPIVGAEPYTRHPTCEVLSFRYNLKDGRGNRFWRPGLPNPQDLFDYLAAGGLLEAWNVGFERYVWRNVCTPRYGWPAVRDEQWRCAMAKARAFSGPGALDQFGSVFDLKIRKDKDGKRLLGKFSVPRNPTKTDARWRVLPVYEAPVSATSGPRLKTDLVDHADTLKLIDYNGTDIDSEAEASSLCPDLEGEELAYWLEDQAINQRGVKIDRKGLEDCIAIIEQCHEQYNAEFARITGIDAASKLEQLKGWLRGQGVHGFDSLDEEGVDALLKRKDIPEAARRALELRSLVGSASVKKVFAMRNRLSSDDRLRDLFIYYGARTGRATGEGPQPTNMPRGGPDVYRCICGRHFGARNPLAPCPWCGMPQPPGAKKLEWCVEAAEDAFVVLGSRYLPMVEHVFGDAMHVVSGCIRALYVAEDGHDLVSSDYSSVEAVGLAALAGEQWRMDVFRTHGKIYETSAAMAFRIPFEEVMGVEGWTREELAAPEWWTRKPAKKTGDKHPLRQKGKGLELGMGYGGWINAARQFDVPGTDDELKRDILAWRAASPHVVWLWGGQTRGKANGPLVDAGRPPLSTNWRGEPDRWDDTPFYFGVEGAAVQAVLNPGVEYPVTRMDGSHVGVRYLRRGEALYCILPSGRAITYHRPRVEPSDRGGLSIAYEGWNTNPKNGPAGWIDIRTFGGRLVENIVQAVCRDILRRAILLLRTAGYPTVLHVYDEIVAEVAKGFGSVEDFERIMAVETLASLEWCRDWPVKAAGGWRGRRYRKG